MRDHAEAICEGLRLDAAGAGLPPALCLFGEDWHQGVAGIVAARIRERYQRPVIALADAGESPAEALLVRRGEAPIGCAYQHPACSTICRRVCSFAS